MNSGEGLGILSYPNDCLGRSALVWGLSQATALKAYRQTLNVHAKGLMSMSSLFFKTYIEVSREKLSRLSSRPSTPSNHKGPKCLRYGIPKILHQLLHDSVILLPTVPKPLPF